MDLKKYIYTHGNNAAADQDFEQGVLRGKVKLGNRYIFWRKAFRWYVVDTDLVVHAYRRVEEVNSGMCCARANFDIQKLVLVLKDGSSLSILIAEGWKSVNRIKTGQEKPKSANHLIDIFRINDTIYPAIFYLIT